MKRILVAVDLSDRAPPVLDYASRLAERTGAKLVLFHAITIPIDFPAQAYTITPSQLTPLLLEQAQTALERLAARVPATQVERVETDIGTPWQAVCRAARTSDVDLIVIGSHGYTALDRLLGTTAARIVNHADRPVLVVRDPAAHPV
jgi:nucleotide-binding universal stress UspA family protein